MKTIGLVGGVASGKSQVAHLLVDQSAGLLDADRVGHAVLAEDREVHDALRRRWGNEVFASDRSVDRAAIARRVFAEGDSADADRQFLEDLLHPRIRRRLESQAREFANAGKRAVVLDAPLLLEAGWDSICNVVLFIDASRDIRLERARRRGWSEAQFDKREAAQWPIDKKREAADIVISNDGSEDELRSRVQQFWNQHVAGR
jgi:dephospho-CoA kinase